MVAFQNAFQSGQQFALEQDRRQQQQRILDEQNLRAEQQQAANEEQRILKNQREVVADEQVLEDREREQAVLATRNVVSFFKAGMKAGASVEEITQRAAPALIQLGVPEEQLQSLAEQIKANPEILDELDATLQASSKRRVFQQDDVTLADGRTGVLRTFTDGTEEFIEGRSKRQSELAAGRLEQGKERIELGQPGTRGRIKEEEAVGTVRGETRGEDLPRSQRATAKGKRAAETRNQRFKLVSSKIDQALSQADAFTAGLLGLTRFVPGTPAANLAGTLDTIRANVGFDELQRLRDGSKTGGALGQVSERENLLLQAVLGSVEQSQSPKQLKANLRILKEQIGLSRDRIADAFEQDFGIVYAGPETPIPADTGDDIEDLLDKFAPVGER